VTVKSLTISIYYEVSSTCRVTIPACDEARSSYNAVSMHRVTS